MENTSVPSIQNSTFGEYVTHTCYLNACILRLVTPGTQPLTISNSYSNVMTWRSINSRGNIKMISDPDFEEIKTQYSPVSEVCERHKIVCCGKKAYNLHTKGEHAY